MPRETPTSERQSRPQQGGVSSGCSGRLWRSDVGVSRGIYGAKPQVIEIVNGRVRVLAA